MKQVEQTLLEALRQHSLTFAAAESCTGGLIAKRLTDVPGASSVFHGGVVSYTNQVKANVLGVPQELLDKHGAVSAPVAKAMARGVRRITGADLGISVTGVAGPDKDDRGNEVGTVFLALSAAQEHDVFCRFLFRGNRQQIRQQAADCAFAMLLQYINKNYLTEQKEKEHG